MTIGVSLAMSRLASQFAAKQNFFRQFYSSGEDGAWFTTVSSKLFQNAAGTTPAGTGDPIGHIADVSGNGNDATQGTTAAKPTLIVAENGDRIIQNDEIDDALTVTFGDLGSSCTVGYVTQSEVWIDEDQTVSGTVTLPQKDLLGWFVIDRALTSAEKLEVVSYFARQATGVNYGGTLSRLQEIMLNAVDVAIYDSADDSDGGTAMLAEGYPLHFVAVAEATAVKIFDATDPEFPLHQTHDFTGYTVSSVACIEGVLVVGTGSGATVLNLADGDSTVTPTHTTATSPAIVNNTVNAVAAYVQPDAPTDGATGLKVPTIAVGTAGGLSVILDDGTVTDSLATLSFTLVAANEHGVIYAQNTYKNWYFATWTEIEAGDGFGDNLASTTAGQRDFDLLTRAYAIDMMDDLIATGGQNASEQAVNGVALYRPDWTDFTKTLSALITTDYNTGWMLNPLGCWLSDSDDTEIVGAAVPADIVTNGDFASDLSGWTVTDFTWDASGKALAGGANGQMSQDVPTVAGSYYIAQLTHSDRTSGRVILSADGVNIHDSYIQNNGTYDASFEAGDASTTFLINAVSGYNGKIDDVTVIGPYAFADNFAAYANQTAAEAAGWLPTGTGAASWSFNQSASRWELDTSVGGATNTTDLPFTVDTTSGVTYEFEIEVSGTANLDNSELRLRVDGENLVFDETGGNNITADGTYTGRMVATASTMSALIRCFNPDGNETANILSVKVTPIVTQQDRSVNGNDLIVVGTITKTKLGEADSLVWCELSADCTVTLDTDISSSGCVYWWEEVAGEPHLYLYDLSGGQDYEDGAPGTAPTTSITFSGADMTLKAGKKMRGVRPTNTIPTAAQIAQIYADELPLINGGAATLTGTDNAVDAVAIDPGTGLVHAGSSDGRSIIDGLERVQKTTASVSTVIAALDGLILEK
ncbi:autotransporter outer membrane beta-barrel domain-containing protein [Maritimibacter alexandrii]|uniref:hypothetical protein n=1 Tax=Maritimibacter alexandrii TaxID=2570355 RepID=UPI00110936E7|nr:hypothetical protein [Maritimibacter alexandrii]